MVIEGNVTFALCTQLLSKRNVADIVSLSFILRPNDIQAKLDITNSDITNSCKMLLISNSLSQSKMLSRIEPWLWELFYKSEIPEVKINLHFG